MRVRILVFSGAILIAAAGAFLLISSVLIKPDHPNYSACNITNLGAGGLKVEVRGLNNHSHISCAASDDGPFYLTIQPKRSEFRFLGEVKSRKFEISRAEIEINSSIVGPEELSQFRAFPDRMARPLYSTNVPGPFYACYKTCIAAYVSNNYSVTLMWQIADGGKDVETIVRNSNILVNSIIGKGHENRDTHSFLAL